MRGELKIDASRIGADALAPGLRVRANGEEYAVAEVRFHKGRPLVRFSGIDDATAAETLVGATLFVARADAALGEGEFFDDDLTGCVLVDADDRELARVLAVEHYPAQDMIRTDRGLVPLVRAFITRVDVAAKRIHVRLPPGLIDGRAEEA